MEGIGGLIMNTIFQLSSSSFDWMSLFEVIKSIPLLGFIQQIREWASPKNKL